VEAAVRRGAGGFYLGNLTNAELYYVMTTPEIYIKTTFSLNGQPVSVLFPLQ
jgi:hypothetical protein